MKWITLLLSLGLSLHLVSQDAVYFKSGKKIKAHVVEITETSIEYKRFNDKIDTTYRSEISLISKIKFSDGRSISFDAGSDIDSFGLLQQDLKYHHGKFYHFEQPLSKREVKNLFAESPEALKLYKGSKKLEGVGIFFTTISVGYLTYGIVYRATDGGYPPAYLAVVFVSAGIGFSSFMVAHSLKKKSVLAYNKTINNSSTFKPVTLHFGITTSGIGIVCRF